MDEEAICPSCGELFPRWMWRAHQLASHGLDKDEAPRFDMVLLTMKEVKTSVSRASSI